MSQLRFDGRVAIITGGGRGLGRAYAELLAERGASVVVNDPGVGLAGEGGDSGFASEVAEAIRAKGGSAIANFDPVGTQEAANRIVKCALEAFGRIDILINNAGIFTPVHSFLETSTDSFQNIFDVHVMGTLHMTRAVWPVMAEQHYGKIINVGSHVAYIGTRGRLEYGTAKGAVHGFSRCLSHEAPDVGISVNVLAPGALTRPVLASTDKFPEEFARAFAPELIAPTLAWLVHQNCRINGEVFTVMAGTTTRIVMGETHGIGIDVPTPEFIRDHFDQVMGKDDLEASSVDFPRDGEERGMELVARFGNREA